MNEKISAKEWCIQNWHHLDKDDREILLAIGVNPLFQKQKGGGAENVEK